MNRPIGLALRFAVIAPMVAEGQQPRNATVRDSAGVQVVSYARNTVPRSLAIRSTRVEAGTEAGAELTRVVSALKMPNGKIIVADAGRRELLRFGPDGAFERVLGRQGAGPGEFNDLRWIGRHGPDSIMTHDGRHFRYSVFTDSGFVRQALLQKSAHLYQIETTLIGVLSDGGPIVTSGGSIVLGDPGPARTERQTFPIVSYAADGRPGRLIRTYPGFEIEVYALREGPRAGAFARRLRLFGTTSAFGVANDQLIVVDNSAFQFDVVDTAGRLVRRVRREYVRERVTAPHLTAYVDERLSAIAPARRAAARKSYEPETFAPLFPALDSRVVIDAAGRIWLGSYRTPGAREQTWWIFTVNGAMVGRVTVPAALTVTDAGNDYLLGVWRDPDGVQTVRLYDLVPG